MNVQVAMTVKLTTATIKYIEHIKIHNVILLYIYIYILINRHIEFLKERKLELFTPDIIECIMICSVSSKTESN